jgi:hypothetical protein
MPYATANYTRSRARDTSNSVDSIYASALQLTLTGSVGDGYVAGPYGIGLPFSTT